MPEQILIDSKLLRQLPQEELLRDRKTLFQ